MAGSKRSERTKVMMENFMTDHRNGLNIPEIAEKYGLSRKTVYRQLGEIAELAGVTRDELLQVVHVRASDTVWERRHAEAKKSLSSIKEGIIQTKQHTDDLLKVLDKILEENEQ